MLRLLEHNEINGVFKDNHSIWSPGLSRMSYQYYQWWQLNSRWGHKNLQYFGFISGNGDVLASCKLYNLEYQSKGRIYKVGGVGAVFVAERNRGKAAGLKLLEALAERCCEEGFDALTLNSDIGPEYYEKIGYEQFNYDSLSVELTPSLLRQATTHFDSNSDKLLDESFVIRVPTSEDVDEMCKHHQRWLAGQPFGIRRSSAYWKYKIERERYLKKHSSLNWPQQEIITDNFGKFKSGYALFETGGKYMRILEVIGPECIQSSLYSHLFRIANNRHLRYIRSWASMAPPLHGLKLTPRDWSLPMILPLNPEFEDEILSWTEVDVPPILELDHF